MATFLVSYDLRNSRNYNELFKALKSYTHWGKILESTWAVVSNESASKIRDDLKTHIDSDDGLFVVKSAGLSAWSNVNCSNEWLKENI